MAEAPKLHAVYKQQPLITWQLQPAGEEKTSFSRRRNLSSEMLSQQEKPTSWQRSQEAAELGLAADHNDLDDHDDHHDVSEHQTFDLSRDPETSEGLDWEKHADENRRKRRRYRLIAVMVGVQVSIVVIALIVWSFTGGLLSKVMQCSHHVAARQSPAQGQMGHLSSVQSAMMLLCYS